MREEVEGKEGADLECDGGGTMDAVTVAAIGRPLHVLSSTTDPTTTIGAGDGLTRRCEPTKVSLAVIDALPLSAAVNPPPSAFVLNTSCLLHPFLSFQTSLHRFRHQQHSPREHSTREHWPVSFQVFLALKVMILTRPFRMW